jgi:RNA polymerase primary sigma factor
MINKNLGFLGDGRNLQRYLKEISKHGKMSSEQEAHLAKRIRLDDRDALNQLICANLKFVVSVCWNYRNQGLSMPDLINEGNLGLIKAARRFDETKQFKFISYAVWWIRQSILQALGEQSRLVKLPFSRIHNQSRITKAHAQLEQKLGRLPTLDELSEFTGLEIGSIAENSRISQLPLSLHAPVSGEDSATLIDFLQDEGESDPALPMMDEDLQRGIEQALKSLTPKEETVLKLHYGIGVESAHSLEEIGIRFNLTRERVRQIKEKALNKLKHATRYRALAVFAEG